jgi:hypothetical protein
LEKNIKYMERRDGPSTGGSTGGDEPEKKRKKKKKKKEKKADSPGGYGFEGHKV